MGRLDETSRKPWKYPVAVDDGTTGNTGKISGYTNQANKNSKTGTYTGNRPTSGENRKPEGNAGIGGGAGAGRGYGGGQQDPYTAQANALYQQLMDRGQFNYDLQGDMLYRQYADQYSQLGQQAMRDVMGASAGLTGGYGNSYAETAGNQAYQQYLNQLNAMVPEFYDRAYQRWQEQGNEMLGQYQLALEKAQEARYRASVGQKEETASDTGAESFLNRYRDEVLARLLAQQVQQQGITAQTTQTVEGLKQSPGLDFDYFKQWWNKKNGQGEK